MFLYLIITICILILPLVTRMVTFKTIFIDKVNISYYVFTSVIWPFVVIILVAAASICIALLIIELLHDLLTF